MTLNGPRFSGSAPGNVTTKLSVITVNLNNATGLSRTLESVAEQGLAPELIVIDGGSTDESVEVIAKYSSKVSYWCSEKDHGIYQAMNKGIRHATGEYLLFLNSGDYLAGTNVLAEIEPELRGSDIISGDLEIIENGQSHAVSSPEKITVQFLRRISLYHQATFIRKELFERLGLYDESFRIGGDYEFFLRTILKHQSIYRHVPQKICVYKADGVSNRPEFLAINKAENKRAWGMNVHGAILEDLNELYTAKESVFYWILRKTKTKNFFYYFFRFWIVFFTGGSRLIRRLRVKGGS